MLENAKATLGPALLDALRPVDLEVPVEGVRTILGIRAFGRRRRPWPEPKIDEPLPIFVMPWSGDGEDGRSGVDWSARDEPRILADRLSKEFREQSVSVHPDAGSVGLLVWPDEIEKLRTIPEVAAAELDLVRDVGLLDGALQSIGAPSMPDSLHDATGVRVAVLDGGIDGSHPNLRVTEAVSTCQTEGIDVPGTHGTHVAGCLASDHPTYRGPAPGIDLFDVKVTTAARRSNQQWFSDGIGAARAFDADILVISLGWSHLPTMTKPGMQCPVPFPDGTLAPCVICRAAESAVADGRLVVVAAGNDHERAEQLRRNGTMVDTELCCPAQATGVITVGAVDDSGAMASFSSAGPGSRVGAAVNLVAPGVDVTSTVPAEVDPGRFSSLSGTSQAAPIVAGALAILLGQQNSGDRRADRVAARDELFNHCVTSSSASGNQAGVGRLTLGTKCTR